MQDAIASFWTSSAYDTCLLLVHPEIRKLENAAGELTVEYDWPHLSIGRQLSAELLSELPERRSRTARRWITNFLDNRALGPVLCTEIDLLFQPTLNLDPLALLRHASRTTRLVVMWPGSYENDVLAYAVPEHSHYRIWRQPDVEAGDRARALGNPVHFPAG